jgi:carboxymethylenebutenolidase
MLDIRSITCHRDRRAGASVEEAVGQMIEFARPDQKRCPGYLATPAGNADAPGVLVLQEYWGMSAPKSNVRQVADRLAAAGYRVLAPDLYHGQPANTVEEARAAMQALDFAEAVSQDIRGAAQHLSATVSAVAALGFCMGGALSLLAAASLPEVAATVCFYGIPPERAADLGRIRGPVLGHFAQHDDWVTSRAIDSLAERLGDGKVTHELHRYDAHHAFMNENRPEVYDPAAAELAWNRTLVFLERALKR